MASSVVWLKMVPRAMAEGLTGGRSGGRELVSWFVMIVDAQCLCVALRCGGSFFGSSQFVRAVLCWVLLFDVHPVARPARAPYVIGCRVPFLIATANQNAMLLKHSWCRG